jgi:amidase
LLESLGHHVETVEQPTMGPELLPAMQTMFFGAYAAREIDSLPPLDTLTVWSRMMVEAGRTVTAADYLRAQKAIQVGCRKVVAVFDDLDLLVTPTVAAPPPLVGQFADIDLSRVAELWALTPFTGLWNTTGQPAVSIPWKLDGEGLPVGVHLVARPLDEAMLFRVSAQIEAAHPWGHWRPPVS